MNEPFRERVYEIVALIPAGRVISYGQLALMAGWPGRARMAARVISHNDRQGLPCHRVVNQNGNLAPPGTFGEGNAQRVMLEAEGVVFKSNGRVDMKNYNWIG